MHLHAEETLLRHLRFNRHETESAGCGTQESLHRTQKNRSDRKRNKESRRGEEEVFILLPSESWQTSSLGVVVDFKEACGLM